MPQDLFGLPTHILLLHVVVVLLPIAAIAAAVAVVSPRFRHRWGLALVACTFVTSLFVPMTSQAGESLAARLPRSASIVRHGQVGQQLVIWTAVFGLFLAAVVALDIVRRASMPAAELTASEMWALPRMPERWRVDPPRWVDRAFPVVQALTMLAALGVVVLVIRAGHSGAQAVWSSYPNLRHA